MSTIEARVVKASLALGDTGIADGTGVCRMPGTLGGRVAVGDGAGVAVEVGSGVLLGSLVGLGIKVAVGSIRLGAVMTTTTGVGVAALADVVGIGRFDK